MDEDQHLETLREIWYSGYRAGMHTCDESRNWQRRSQRERRWMLGVAILMLSSSVPVLIVLTVLLLRAH